MVRSLLTPALIGLVGLVGLVHPLPNPNPNPSSLDEAESFLDDNHKENRRNNNGDNGVDGGWNDIITGVYSQPPLLKIHDRSGNLKWSWARDDVGQTNQQLPAQIQQCLYSQANDATEIKWIKNGTAIAAVYSNLVLIINHAPGQQSDKQITFAACRENNYLSNTHTLEPLPGGKVAVSTTGARPWDGILVYNANEPLSDNPPIIQNITGLRAAHGMIWDETAQILWAAGTNAAPDNSDNIPAYGTLQGYPYDAASGQLRVNDSLHFQLPQAHHQDPEWGPDHPWWVGPHDLAPIPNQRKFIMTDDEDLHVFDLESHQWAQQGQDVVNTYLKGFQPTTNDRHGLNRQGQFVDLPRSDVKSVSLAPDGSFVYVQSLWQKYQGNHTNLVVNGQWSQLDPGSLVYRARFFADIPGWPKPAA